MFSQTENSLNTNSEFSNEIDEETTTISPALKHLIKQEEEETDSGSEEDSDSEEFQPRIVQVTNFQQITGENQSCSSIGGSSLTKTSKLIKEELASDSELRTSINNQSNTAEEEENSSDGDIGTILSARRPSLFTKHTKRQWPWLIDNNNAGDLDDLEDKTETLNTTE